MNKNEQIGTMRERVQIERVSETRTTSGASTDTWELLAEVWANVSYRIVPSDEEMLADKKTAITETVFTIRTHEGLTAKDRIVYRGGVYDITAITETQMRERMQISAKERV